LGGGEEEKGLFQASAVNRAVGGPREAARPLPPHHRLQGDSAREKDCSGMRELAHSAVIRTRSAPPQHHALVCVDGSCVGRRRNSRCVGQRRNSAAQCVVIYSDAEALDRRCTEANTQAPPLSRARSPFGLLMASTRSMPCGTLQVLQALQVLQVLLRGRALLRSVVLLSIMPNLNPVPECYC
jgi:hypothetical protein